MKNLQLIIDHKNFMSTFTKEEKTVLPLNQKQINDFAETIDCQMSPENLCCDGEASRTHIRTKARHFNGAFAELKKHAKSQGLSITVKTWEI